ncbi:MAG: hypothetical protein ABRQ38_28495, partial [Candidatus Eremiobacterota bacterium]
AYQTGSGATVVMKYNGIDWIYVGNYGFTAGTADCLSLFVSNGIPYIGYIDIANGNKSSVMKFSN